MLAFLLGLLSLLIFVKPVLAGNPPTQTSPTNNSTVSSSTLNWQTPAYPVCATYSAYRIQVDDDPSFPGSSIYRNVYTGNTYYSPQLSPGIWYWRVMARDESCNNWSDWSSVWSFTLSTESPSPTPNPPLSPSPSPAPSTTQQSTSFNILNVPSQINSDQQFNITVNLSLPSNPNTTFYLKGAFKKPDGSNYFGETFVSGSFVKNSSSFTNQHQITTDSSGNWSGILEVRSDDSDSGFTGTADYIFKVGRYTGSGSGPTWSNESTIKIISAENQPEGTTTASSPATSPISSPSTKTEGTSFIRAKNSGKLTYRIASVAAATTAASPLKKETKVDIKSQKQTNPALWAGLILIIAGVSSIGYIYYKNGKIRI